MVPVKRSQIPDNCAEAVVIDNINAVEDEDIRNEIAALFNRKKIWLILAGRSKMPSWLLDSIIKRNMIIITEDDLALTTEGIDRYMRSEGIILTEEELRFQRQSSEGNLIAIKYTQGYQRQRLPYVRNVDAVFDADGL